MSKQGFWEKVKGFWKDAKAWAFKYLGALFMEEKDGKLAVSIGRVLLLVTFIAMLWYWRKIMAAGIVPGQVAPALPDGLLEAFYALLGYVLSGKAVTAYRGRPMKFKAVAGMAAKCVDSAPPDDDLLK